MTRKEEKFKWTVNKLAYKFADQYRAVISNLPPRYKRVFEMHFHQSIPQAKIAFTLGVQVPAVSKIVGNIRNRFTALGMPPPEADVYRMSGRGTPIEYLDENG